MRKATRVLPFAVSIAFQPRFPGPGFPDIPYAPASAQNKRRSQNNRKRLKYVVGRAGFEPATRCLKGSYSTA